MTKFKNRGVYPISIEPIGSGHEFVEEGWPTEAASLSSDHTGLQIGAHNIPACPPVSSTAPCHPHRRPRALTSRRRSRAPRRGREALG
jgi:hypothetical protein